MPTYIIIAIVFVGVTVIAFLAGLASGRSRRDVGHALRALLLDRSEGRVTAEEFERRQSALHASLMDGQPIPSRIWQYLLGTAALAIATATAVIAWLANPESIQTTPAPTSAPQSNASGMAARPGGDLQDMTNRLAARLSREPNDGPGWVLLARAYTEMRQFNEAQTAFETATRLLPQDASIFAEWANAYVQAKDGKWDKQALDIVKRALAINPAQVKALALAGAESFSRGDYKQATAYWERMKTAATPGSIEAKLAEENLAAARAGGPVSNAPRTPAMERMLKSTR